ncbi:MAG: LysR family transcriptional regulator [Burkholderiales bacterium]|nr:LysR family transcriptional regulator [Burkholderiales bacterium]
MNAAPQYSLGPADLSCVLALVRGVTLASAGERLGVDSSTVFRHLQRLERGLGQALFERSRTGYRATELALALAAQAEQVEAALEAARAAAQAQPEQAAGSVRISTTDAVLQGLLAPALVPLRRLHPLLSFELQASNELASLRRRDADIALRATRRPPPHLVGQHLGPIRVALYAAKGRGVRHPARLKAQLKAQVDAGQAPWIAPDDALPDHPTVLWRRRHFPKLQPVCRVNSMLAVLALVAQGVGVGLLPMFLAESRPDLLRLGDPLDECQHELWLLTHVESRHLRRVATVYAHLAQALRLH